MTVEPTCRFCHRKFGPPIQSVADGAVYLPHYAFECKACHSVQFFENNGKALHYWFVVNNKYLLYFQALPQSTFFQITDYTSLNTTKVYLTLDYIPTNITPQNITEEKIKLWILFS
jgi:hypothetical protein